MAETEARIGYGASFHLSNGTTLTEIAEVFSVSPPNPQTDDVEATHYKSLNRTREYIAGLIDPGEITIEMNYIAGSASDLLLRAAQAAGAVREAKISLPTDDGTWDFEFPAIVKGYEVTAPVDDRMTATITLRVAGAVTESASGA